MGWTVAATLIASAVAAATAKMQTDASRRATGAQSSATTEALDYQKKQDLVNQANRDRADAEAKAQHDAAQLQADEDRAIANRRYGEEKDRVDRAEAEAKAQYDAEQKRRDAETVRQTKLDAENLSGRQAEFNFLTQQYAARQARVTEGLAGLAQRWGDGGAPPVAPRVLLPEMPPGWKSGDSIFASGPTPGSRAPSSFEDSSQFPVQLPSKGLAPAASTGTLPLSALVSRREVPTRPTPVMSEAAYQALAAERGGRAPAAPLPLSVLAKAKKARVKV